VELETRQNEKVKRLCECGSMYLWVAVEDVARVDAKDLALTCGASCYARFLARYCNKPKGKP
jgi:hypothetical protein